jgi:4-hydroxythreonine-4-phosphate dehydrogenase
MAPNPKQVCPILAVTLGEPAGIGPDIFLKIIQQPQPAHLIVFGSPDLLLERAKFLGLNIKLNIININNINIINNKINIIPIALTHPVQPGQLSVHHSPYVLESLRQATDACLNKQCHAMVTGPVHKTILRQYDKIFIDQTHLISAQCKVNYNQVMMGFISPGMKLGLATLHEPIHRISSLLTPDLVKTKILNFARDISTFFQIPRPKIGILGLNPHAGENGLIGTEEQNTLFPCLQEIKKNHPDYQLSDLLSPDSAFISPNRAYYDGFLAWYHDQGLAPFKTLYEQNAATILFGLPIIRTSVDHGTALPLAGTDKADAASFQYAIHLASTIVNNLNK